MSTRAERSVAVARMRTLGMTYRDIANHLDISASYVRDLVYDPTGAKTVARKESYRGTCTDCGKKTTGSGGPAAAPTLCASCAAKKQHNDRHWTPERVIEAIQRYARDHGRPPFSSEWLNHRNNGYPCCRTVQREFGSWAAGIEAAGFPRPEIGRYERTVETRSKMGESQRKRWGICALYGDIRAITLSLGVDQIASLERRAQADNTSVSEQTRRAVAAYLVGAAPADAEKPNLFKKKLFRAA